MIKVNIYGTTDAVIEESEVKTEIALGSSFPRQSRVSHEFLIPGSLGCIRRDISEYGIRTEMIVHTLEIALCSIRSNGRRTRLSSSETELELADPGKRFHEFLLIDAPSKGNRRE